MRAEPTVSVVVASTGPEALLERCLAALVPQAARHTAEIVVARLGDAAPVPALAAAHPTVRFVTDAAVLGLPQLRALGLAAATGDIIALTEDRCVVAPDWLDTLVSAAADGAAVTGGVVDGPPGAGAAGWAAYFAEYGSYADGAGTPPAIAAANVAYRRSVVDEVIDLAASGEWEDVVHRSLLARGSSFAFLDSAAVHHHPSPGAAAFCRNRFRHGRDYARRRLRDEGTRRRWLFLGGSWLLPALLTVRLARAVGRRRRGMFLRALPFTVVFLTVWAAGEAWGYLRGPASADD